MDVKDALSRFTTSWTTQVNLALIALIAFYIQLFFCQRLWLILRELIVTLLVTLFVFALIAAIVSVCLMLNSRYGINANMECVFMFAGKSKNVTWSKEAVETSWRVFQRDRF
ncbi:hypothetical protein C8R44DRAFT_889955 [Mycena epipterygia]|nr:hypothetical protein C8R44DRAFT_889955 [Mycena epipterygia]